VMRSEEDLNVSHYQDETGGTTPDESRGEAARESTWVRLVPTEVYIFLFYLLVTLFLTWPVIIRFTTTAYGFPSDNLGTMWQWWWIRNAGSFGGHASASFCTIAGYPFGTALKIHSGEFVFDLGVRFLLLFAGEVAVNNLIILSSFFLSGVTMYYLVRHVTGDKVAAFFGGFAFMIGAFHAIISMAFANLAMTQWIPLFILFLLFFIEKPTYRNALLLFIGAILVAGTNLHYGLFMAIFTASFLLGRFAYLWINAWWRMKRGDTVTVERPAFNRKTFGLAILVILATTLVVFPFYYAGLKKGGAPVKWPTKQTPGTLRDVETSVAGSAQLIDYIVPPKESRFVGFITRKIAAGRSLFSNALYLGWIIIVLAVLAVFLALRRKTGESDGDSLYDARYDSGLADGRTFNEGRKPILWGFVFAAVVAFVFSLPPYIRLWSSKIYLPSILFHYIAPWFRWYNRLSIVVITCMIVLACFSVSWLVRRLGRVGELLVVLLMALLFMEMTLVPPFKYFRTDDVPRVYRSISQLPNDSALVFYPAFEPGFFNAQQYLFYQRSFRKPLLNGTLDDSDGEALRRTVYNPYNPAVPSILARYGFTNIVYLGKMFEQYEGTEKEDREVGYLPAGFKREKRFPSSDVLADAYLYGIDAQKAILVPIYQGDITVPHIDKGRITVRLMDRDGIIRIVSYAKEALRVRAGIPLSNLRYSHRIIVSQDGRVLWNRELNGNEQGQAIVEFAVPPGGTQLRLEVEGKKWPLSQDEKFVFGAKTATVRVGDVVLEPL